MEEGGCRGVPRDWEDDAGRVPKEWDGGCRGVPRDWEAGGAQQGGEEQHHLHLDDGEEEVCV